jgi:hypothetical protein
MLSIATYSPGLDLWDPLEKAFKQCCDVLEKSKGRRAILIVGNSPPIHPTQPGSPLAVLRMPPGVRVACHTRRQNLYWHETLARCASLGIPVIYLFLLHTKFGRVPAETYKESQARVQRAMSETVSVEAVDAEPADVQRAVLEVIRSLRTQASLASAVELGYPL